MASGPKTTELTGSGQEGIVIGKNIYHAIAIYPLR